MISIDYTQIHVLHITYWVVENGICCFSNWLASKSNISGNINRIGSAFLQILQVYYWQISAFE